LRGDGTNETNETDETNTFRGKAAGLRCDFDEIELFMAETIE
jgi:hypothetical protein